MATEKILSTKIKLRYDSYFNWTSKNPTLLEGEVAIAYVETPATAQEVGSVDNSTSRQVLMKVGPGAYNSLQFISAKAADVHAWAKKSEEDFTTWVKSLVSVDDIDLSNYYNKTEVNNELAKKVDKVTGKSLVSDSEITKLEGVSEGANKVEASATNGKIKIDGVDTTVYTHPATHAIADVDGLQNALNDKVAKENGKGLSTNDLTDTLKGNYDAAYDHSQVAHAPANAQANVIEGVKVNGTAQTITGKSVDITVPTKVSELENDNKYLVAADIANKADKATTLAGYGIGDAYTKTETDDKITDAINTFTSAYITSDGGAIDKLQEIADWIDSDKNGSADVIADIEANAEAIEAINDADTGILKQAKDYADGLAGNYAEAEHNHVVADITDFETTVEVRITAKGYATTDYADDKASDAQTAAEATAAGALASAKSELESKINAIDNHSHANKTELDKIADGDVAKWNEAEQNAKDYSDGKLAEAKTAISAEIDADVKEVNDALEAYKISNDAEVAKKANNADLKAVAKSGLIDDLSIGEGTVLIFDCGNATV